MMNSTKSKLDEKVWSLHCKGLAPSQIDERLNLSKGEAKSIIIRCWRMDWSIGRMRLDV